MPIRRPVRVGVALLGVLGLAGPAWGQTAPADPNEPSADRGAYEAFVPLLERDEPHPSFWGETDPPGDAEPAEGEAEAEPAADAAQASHDGGGGHEHR